MASKTKSTPEHAYRKSEVWYEPFVVPGIVAVVLSAVVLVFVPGEIDRFTLIMPIFAGYILYMILTAVEDEEEAK